MIKLSQYSRCSGRDSKRGHPKYECSLHVTAQSYSKLLYSYVRNVREAQADKHIVGFRRHLLEKASKALLVHEYT
jgi:DNA gyrase/topoisomerase IV subunit B